MTGKPPAARSNEERRWPWPLPNVWLGVSVEDQENADERIPHLLNVPAAVRFLSVEPQLGPVDLLPFLHGRVGEMPVNGARWVIVGGESGNHARPFHLDWARSIVKQCEAAGVAVFVKQLGQHPTENPTHWRDWDWREQGARICAANSAGLLECSVDLRDSHGGNWDEWPAGLRVREFPAK